MPKTLRLALIGTSFSFAACSDDGLKAFNTDPVAEITSHTDGDIAYEGYTITLVAALSDANHRNEDLKASWKAGNQEICPFAPPDENGDSICVTTLGLDQQKVQVEVRDIANAAGESVVTLEIVPTEAPEITITSPSDTEVYYSDRMITFSGIASDAEDSPEDLIITWNSSIDGDLSLEPIPNQDGEFSGATNLTEGEHYLTLTVEDSTGKTDTADTIIQVGGPNTEPLCGISAPLDGAQHSRGEIIQFTGFATDEHTPANLLDVSWISNVQGELTQSIPNNDGSVSFTSGELEAALHTITLQVTDELGETCTESVQVTVGEPPDITISSPLDGSLYQEGEVVTFSATVLDPEGAHDSLIIRWLSDIDGNLNQSSPNSAGSTTFVNNTLASGTHLISLEATTTTGYTTAQSISVLINGAPSQPTVTLSPNPAYSNDDLTATISDCIDPEGDPISYNYTWFRDGVQTSHSSNTVPATDIGKNETWSVSVTPSDNNGGTGPTGQGSITIDNTAPAISSISFSPSSVGAHDVVSCVVNWTDPDETPAITYNWQVDGVSAGSSSSIDLGAIGSTPGETVSCAAVVTDSDNASDSSSANVVIGNSLPVVSAINFSPSNVYTNDTITASVNASDSDGQAVTLQYEWFVDGASVQNGTDNTLDGSTHFDKNQSVYVIVTPNDGVDDGLPVTSNINTILNSDPVITTIVITPSTGLVHGDSISCAATATDNDNETPTISYEWLVNGTSVATGASTTLSSAYRGDTVACQATATDSDAGTGSDSASTIMENTAPTISSVSFSPASPGSQDSITCNPVGASDVDSDPLSYTYQWQADGVTLAETTDTLGPSYSPGTVISCTITPFDGYEQGNSVQGDVTIDNSLPVINSISLSPSTVYTNDTITATVSASDSDGQAVTLQYEWFVDGASVQSGTDNTLDGSTHFDKDQSVHVVVTPNDGITNGSPSTSTSSTISNTAPVIPTISFSPADPEPGVDDVLCQVDSVYDEDGDPLTYDFVWTQEGATYNGTQTTTNQTGDTIPSSEPNNAETWSCTLTVTDDSNASATSATIEVMVGCIEESGTKASCAADDCGEILFDGFSQGDGLYWIDPTNSGDAYEVYCLMDSSYDGGGWTMIWVSSDDGTDSWSYDNLSYFTSDDSTFGDLANLNLDYKSQALHEVGMTDLLFFHPLSGEWAAYANVANGVNGYEAFAQNHTNTSCYEHGEGYAMTAGSIQTGGLLCSTELFMSALDRDGGSCSSGNGDDAYGPSWSVRENQGLTCLFDDPGHLSSLGPNALSPSEEGISNSQVGGNPLGFGWALGLNTGNPGSGDNYMQVLVRRSLQDADGDGVRDWEDCDPNDPTIGATDDDGDGYIACFDDCDDSDAAMNHDDADGDGYTSCEGDCDDTDPNINLDDNDGDGYSSCDGDCDDANSAYHPFAGDTVGDNIDTDCDNLDCAADFYGDTYFVVCNLQRNWNDATNECINSGYDGLATIRDASEQSYLAGARLSGYFHWIGLNDIAQESDFVWSSGEAVNFTSWQAGEPNNSGNEDCVGMNATNSAAQYRNLWNDGKCNNQSSGPWPSGFICESR